MLTLSQVIDRPRSDVFGAIVNIESVPRWNPTTKSARKLSTGELGEGTTFELTIRGFGRTIQELRGHHDVSTTMIYTHVLNRGGLGVRSPLDGGLPQ